MPRPRATASTTVTVSGVPFLTDQFTNARVIVEFAWGANLNLPPSSWVWTDETANVRNAGQVIQISQGRPDETSQASAATCSFELDNSSGNYSTGNPGGSHYPFVRRNTPVRVSIDTGSVGAVLRFQGYADGFPPAWDATANLAIITFSASGILRRLGQGNTPLHSPMQRALVRSAAVAYWSLEDGPSSTQGAADIGIYPLTLQGGAAPSWGNQAGPTGSDQLPTFNSGQLNASVSTTGFTGRVHLTFVVKFPTITAGKSCNAVTIQCQPGPTAVSRFGVVGKADADGGLALTYTRTDGTLGTISTGAPVNDGAWHLIDLELVGTSLFSGLTTASVSVDQVAYPGGASVYALSANGLGGITNLTVNPTQPSALYPSIGHVAIIYNDSFTSGYNSYTGNVGETATARLTRLCAEQGISLSLTGTSDVTMGPQGIDTLLNLLRECETTDGGVLGDGFGPGLTYVARQSRYNQSAVITLNMATGEVDDPFAPIDDDQRNRNSYKVDRKNGSSATFTDRTGPLGSDTIGLYDSSLTVNSQDDTGLMNRAAWEVRRGTIDGLRYPTLNLDLRATPARVTDWLGVQCGERADILNVSSVAVQHPPGTVSLIVEGYTETLSPLDWTVAATCSSATPYRNMVITPDSPSAEYAWRIDSGASTLAQDYAAGVTSLSVRVSDGYLWSTFAGDYPVDISVGGVQVTVNAVSGTSSPQTFTVAPTAYALRAGWAVSEWRPPMIAL